MSNDDRGVGSGRERKGETIDDLLDGFGADRPNLPRILPALDNTTPPPAPPKKELLSTAPGARQRRARILATVVAFALVTAAGVAFIKCGMM
jgi:hypothetical protein